MKRFDFYFSSKNKDLVEGIVLNQSNEKVFSFIIVNGASSFSKHGELNPKQFDGLKNKAQSIFDSFKDKVYVWIWQLFNPLF